MRARNSRSLRQCSNLDTMIRTRHFVPAARRCHCMPNLSATGPKASRSESRVAGPPGESPDEAKWSRMKKWPSSWESNCLLSRMSQPCFQQESGHGVHDSPGLRAIEGQNVVSGGAIQGIHGSALDHVHGQASAGGFLVLGLHVRSCLTHGLDRFVQRYFVAAVPVQAKAGSVDGLHTGDGAASIRVMRGLPARRQ